MKVEIRLLKLSDYDDLYEAMALAYKGLREGPWEHGEVAELIRRFPDGQIAVTVDDKVVGCALALIIDYKRFGDSHTYNQITDNGRFRTHTDEGDVLYGIDVFVHPDHRGLRLARRLYSARKDICRRWNLKSIMAGGRIPGYKNHAAEMSPSEYIEKVRSKEIYDAILTFQLSNGFHVRKLLRNYLPSDSASRQSATLLEWDNVDYELDPYSIESPKSVIRIGVVQWQMRPASTIANIIDQVEYFVDTVSDYESDFILFPEFFSAPLMSKFNQLGQAEAMRKLAEATPEILKKLQEFAVSYNVNIVAGSLPVVEDGQLYNVAHLCRRDGTQAHVKKVHITPSEQEAYGMCGGSSIHSLDTDCGKIGILICYDVEFPELSRLLCEEGADILFVPFMTDLQTGFNRVRHCAQARAIENECYVAIAGSVGNLPRVDNMDIQYARSAVFSPSDFAFPPDGVVAEATPNTEMALLADIDLSLLKRLREHGSVRNRKDRRDDLYELRWKK